jgi:hypothetical protein
MNGDEEDVDCGGSCPSICKTICCDDVNKIYYSDKLLVLIRPNPVHDILILNIEYDEAREEEFEILSVEILTVTGISVWKEQLSLSKEILVDVSSLQDGFYMLRVQDENDGIFLRRFIRH